MKKLLSIILSITLMMTALSFTGCAPTTETPTESDQIVLANFEQFEPDFQLIRLVDGFGSVSVNKDKKFVKGGNVSAKLQPLGDYASGKRPVMYIPFASERFDYDYKNMLKFETISMWVYNAENEYKTMEIGFVTGIVDLYSVSKVFGKNVSLKPGWNRINYYPDHSALNIASDVTNYYGLYLSFDHVHSRDVNDAPVFYVDDVELKKAKEDVVVENVLVFDQNEIVDWEKAYQQSIYTYNTVRQDLLPDLKIVTSEEAGITASSGDKMLKIVTKQGETLNASYPGFVIVDKVLKMSGYMNIGMDEWTNYDLCFDVYAENTDITLFAEFYCDGNMFAGRKVHSVVAKKGQWTTFRKSFMEFLTDNIKKPGQFILCYAEDPAPIQKVFYFDNFRFEKRA